MGVGTAVLLAQGSSPRMRGSPIAGARSCCAPGIIPAHAGLTSCCPIFIGKHGAHHKGAGGIAKVQGSSPRMRGSRSIKRGDDEMLGIIPAHAGLTSSALMIFAIAGDHPRACGAHQTLDLKLTDSQGSSPRMRGSPWVVRPGRAADGIIPAHAGLTKN